MYVDPARARARSDPGLARGRGVQEVRLQRARQVVRRRRGVRRAGSRSTRNYDACLVSSMAVAPHYAEAFGQPLDLFASRLGLPRTDLFADPARRDRAPRAAVRATLRPAGRPADRPLRADVPRRHRRPGPLRRPAGPARHARRRWATTTRAAQAPPVRPRRRLEIPPDLAAFAIDASADPDLNELMLVSDVLVTDYSSAIYEFALLGRPIAFFAPDDEAYERRARLLLRLPGGPAGPGVRDDGRAGGGDPGRTPSTSSGCGRSRRRRSTSSTGARPRGSSTRCCCPRSTASRPRGDPARVGAAPRPRPPAAISADGDLAQPPADPRARSPRRSPARRRGSRRG